MTAFLQHKQDRKRSVTFLLDAGLDTTEQENFNVYLIISDFLAPESLLFQKPPNSHPTVSKRLLGETRALPEKKIELKTEMSNLCATSELVLLQNNLLMLHELSVSVNVLW